MSAMVAVVLTLAHLSYDTSTLLVLSLLSSCCATLYQLYWDVVVDWGLLQQNSKNPWLRDNLILRRKYLYYISMVLLLLYTILESHFLIHFLFSFSISNPSPKLVRRTIGRFVRYEFLKITNFQFLVRMCSGRMFCWDHWSGYRYFYLWMWFLDSADLPGKSFLQHSRSFGVVSGTSTGEYYA